MFAIKREELVNEMETKGTSGRSARIETSMTHTADFKKADFSELKEMLDEILRSEMLQVMGVHLGVS